MSEYLQRPFGFVCPIRWIRDWYSCLSWDSGLADDDRKHSPSSRARCRAATRLQYPVHDLPRKPIAKVSSELGLSDQKQKFNRSMVKMKSTVLASFDFGWSSCSDQVLKLYFLSCIKVQIIEAAALHPRESSATSIELLYTYSASCKTLVSAGREGPFVWSPNDCRRSVMSSSSTSSSDMSRTRRRLSQTLWIIRFPRKLSNLRLVLYANYLSIALAMRAGWSQHY